MKKTKLAELLSFLQQIKSIWEEENFYYIIFDLWEINGDTTNEMERFYLVEKYSKSLVLK